MSDYNLKNIVFFRLKIFFTFTNSVEPDEMQHYAAFHLGLFTVCKSTRLGVSRIQSVKQAVKSQIGRGLLSDTINQISRL